MIQVFYPDIIPVLNLFLGFQSEDFMRLFKLRPALVYQAQGQVARPGTPRPIPRPVPAPRPRPVQVETEPAPKAPY